MGAGCSGSRTNTRTNAVAALDPSSDYYSAINSELAPYLAIESPYNINHKYNHFFKIIRDQYVGDGLKKTLAYSSKITLEELNVKRNEYWETRVEGEEKSWKALRLACEAPEGEDGIKAMIAAGLKLINKTLQLAFDKSGHKYDVPVFCINDPSIFDLPKKREISKEELTGKPVDLKFRKAGVAHDVKLQAKDNWSTLELKQEYIRKVNEDGLEPQNIRLFFGGKEFKEDTVLAEYCIQDGQVIQVFRKQNANK
jgi:hypothetical protein